MTFCHIAWIQQYCIGHIWLHSTNTNELYHMVYLSIGPTNVLIDKLCANDCYRMINCELYDIAYGALHNTVYLHYSV